MLQCGVWNAGGLNHTRLPEKVICLCEFPYERLNFTVPVAPVTDGDWPLLSCRFGGINDSGAEQGVLLEGTES